MARRIGMLAVVGAMVWVVPANATVIEQNHYSDSFTEDIVLCGIPVHIDDVFSGVFHFRVGKGKDASAFFASDNFQYVTTITNPANGKFYTEQGNGLFHETKATQVEGSIFEFTQIESGQPYSLTDSDGNILLRDRGVIRETIQFDTLGDDTPGGDFIESISTQVSGPHPGFDQTQDEYCALVTPLLS